MTLSAARRRALESNLRRFIVFRLCYSARFYYPVFTVLFLDYGLTLEQFSLLNLVWAFTIVSAEIPSGALADVLGRRPLVVFAAALMVVQMALILFAPMNAPLPLFLMFLANRVCSGLSEAAASGADEALAFDSLQALGREEEWAALLERSTRVVSVGFFVAMILGGLAYDPAVVNRLLGAISADLALSDALVIRLPVLLTLLTAMAGLVAVLGLVEPGHEGTGAVAGGEGGRDWGEIAAAFGRVGAAARWTRGQRFVLFVILAALALDSVARQFVLLSSEYWRQIDIPVAWFGLVGAGLSLLGIVHARVARYLVRRHSPGVNFLLLSAVLLLGLGGLALAIPYVGVLFAIAAFAMLTLVQFQTSYYLNRAVDSAMRATVLSFRGLALNLGLGLASLCYALLVAGLRAAREGPADGVGLQREVFLDTLPGLPLYFLLWFLFIVALAWWTSPCGDPLLRRPR